MEQVLKTLRAFYFDDNGLNYDLPLDKNREPRPHENNVSSLDTADDDADKDDNVDAGDDDEA